MYTKKPNKLLILKFKEMFVLKFKEMFEVASMNKCSLCEIEI